MRTLVCGAAFFALCVASVSAEPRSDMSIDKAAARIVAGKMGDIRGGFSYRDQPQFMPVEQTSGSRARADSIRISADGNPMPPKAASKRAAKRGILRIIF